MIIKSNNVCKRRCSLVLKNGKKCSNRFISGANRKYCKKHSGTKEVKKMLKKLSVNRKHYSDSDFI